MATAHYRNPAGNHWLDGKRKLYRRGRWVESRMAQPGDVLVVEDADEFAIPSHFERVSGPSGDPEPAPESEAAGETDGDDGPDIEPLDVSEYETKPGSNWFDIPGQERKIQGADAAREALAAHLAAEAEGSDAETDEGDDEAGDGDGGAEEGADEDDGDGS